MAEIGRGEAAGPKRFYGQATVEPHADGFALRLDGRQARTRGGRDLTFPNRKFGEAVADEWRTAGERIDFAAMPLTRLRMTVLDRADADREAWRLVLTTYLETDLLSYRAETPAALRNRQSAVWDPVLGDLARATGIELATTTGIGVIDQPETARARARAIIDALDDDCLLCLKEATELLGSVALAMALNEGLISRDAAFEAARLDEDFQIERWGRDAQADAVTARRKAAFYAVCDYLAALGRFPIKRMRLIEENAQNHKS